MHLLSEQMGNRVNVWFHVLNWDIYKTSQSFNLQI